MSEIPKPAEKPQKPKRFRKVKRFLIAGFALLALAVLSFPIWSIYLVKPLAHRLAGIEIESVEAQSWQRWKATGISFQTPELDLQVKSAELPSPTELILQILLSRPASQSLVVENWSVATHPVKKPEKESGPLPTIPFIASISNQSLEQLGRYLTAIELRNGKVNLDGQDTLDIARASITPSLLQAELVYLPQNAPATIEIDATDPKSWFATAEAESLQTNAKLELKIAEESVSVDGTLTSYSNPVSINATWTDTQSSFLPQKAEIKSQTFNLDDRYLFWEAAPSLSINATASWEDHRYEYRIEGFDTDVDAEGSQILLAGGGSLENLEIASAKVNLPWLSLESDQPILIDFNLQDPLSAAQLEAKLDLSRIPFVEAKGSLTARLQTKTSEQGEPTILVTFDGSGISFFDTTLDTVNAKIDLIGPIVTLHSLSIKSSQGSEIAAQGLYNLEDQTLASTSLELNLNNESQRLRDLIPWIEWQTLKTNLEVSGNYLDPTVEGKLESVGLQAAALLPLNLNAEFNGTLNQLNASLRAINQTETLDLDLDFAQSQEAYTIVANSLSLARLDGTPILDSAIAFTTRIQKLNSSTEITEIVLNGANESQVTADEFLISLDDLKIHAGATNLDSGLLNHWLAKPIPSIYLQDFDTKITLNESVSEIVSSGVASWPLDNNKEIDLSWLLNSDPKNRDNLIVDHLEVGADSKHILVAQGQFPISINWAQSSLQTKIHQDTPLSFSLKSSPHPDFWKSLEGFLPVTIKRPVMNAQVTGTLEKPEGVFDLKLAELSWSHPDDPAKSFLLTELEAGLDATSEEITVRSLNATSGKNQIHAEAVLPLKNTKLTELFNQEQTFEYKDLNASAKLDLRDLENFKAWLPPIMRHEGTAQVDIKVSDGELYVLADVKGLATRPLPPLGAVSEISGQVSFKDKQLTANRITGIAESSAFTLSGTADLTDIEAPIYDLAFSSKEFPLVRDSGILLTSDIDLKLVSTDGTPPTISGDLRLTKGLFLVEPDLLAGSTKTVSSRPPYFAVEIEPFAQWGLDLDIRGDKFLRVSNSFFEGTLSAEFGLEGTLGNPLLVGKATADSGRISFPASSLNLTRGQVYITRDRPSELQIDATATGRTFAYDINLSASGTVEKPDLVITTNPGLTQVDALLLLTTGTIPSSKGELAQSSSTSLGIFIGKGLFRKLSGGGSDTSSKLSIEVGKDITKQKKNTIEASYEISDKLVVEGAYDKRDEYNANFKWTIYER